MRWCRQVKAASGGTIGCNMQTWIVWLTSGHPSQSLILQGFTEQDRWFDVAVKVAREFMKAHIISSDSDRIAVVFYGSVSACPAAGPPLFKCIVSCSGRVLVMAYLACFNAGTIIICVQPERGSGKCC